MAVILDAPHQARADGGPRTLALISLAHWVSHFHMLVLPMLMPFLKTVLGIGYVELGFALTMFAVVTALSQTPVGYLVDHFGARKILLFGLSLGGLAFVLIGLHPSYRVLIAGAVLLGLANSVYHPANYAILAAHMDETRMGRAFSIHTFAGYLGFAMAPAIVGALASFVGGSGALVMSGAIGITAGLLLILFGVPEASGSQHRGAGAPGQRIVSAALIMLTVFFTLLGLSSAGINNFGVVALMNGYGASFSAANLALTSFLAAGAVGVLAGGFLADHTQRHGQFAAVCFGANAAIVALITLVVLPQVLLVTAMTTAGFLGGVIAPSRDMLVRNAAPAGAMGRAFGIVSTGFNFAGIVSPLLFGWIMDQSLPHWVFGLSAVFMALTVVLAPFTERKPAAALAVAKGSPNHC